MDLANTLIRSITRAFYKPEHQIIMDAVLMHSTLRDDDLALLMGQQTKHLRKECFKLREDGLLSVHSRDEIREGSNRPFKRDFYFVDTHRAIDVIKYRVKSIGRAIEKRYGQTVEEKKEFCCPRCKAAYTQMEVLDSVNDEGFFCKRCLHTLKAVEDDGTSGAGHEVQSRLNAQMAVFEGMLRQIDSTDIPENTFNDALSRAVDVKRDANINPAMRTQVVANSRLPAGTVHGLKVDPEKVEVNLMDEEKKEEAAKEEAERKAKFLEQNTLPTWHTASTVGLGPDAGGAPRAAHTNGSLLKKEESDIKTINMQAVAEEEKAQVDNDELAKYFAMQQDDDEEEDDESDSGEESEGEEEEEAPDEAPPIKRVRIEEPPSSAAKTNGSQLDGADTSGDESQEDG